MGDLSKNFSVSEFLAPKALGTTELNKYKLHILCNTILQPLRDRYGSVTVTSGIRAADTNDSVGGAAGSHHLYHGDSCAVDLVLIDHATDHARRLEAFAWILANCKFAFGELIWYEYTNHFHIALPSKRHPARVGFTNIDRKHLAVPADPVAAMRYIRDADRRFKPTTVA